MAIFLLRFLLSLHPLILCCSYPIFLTCHINFIPISLLTSTILAFCSPYLSPLLLTFDFPVLLFLGSTPSSFILVPCVKKYTIVEGYCLGKGSFLCGRDEKRRRRKGIELFWLLPSLELAHLSLVSELVWISY